MIVYKVTVVEDSGTKHHWFAKKGESKRAFRTLTKQYEDAEVTGPDQCEITGGRPGLVAFLSSLDGPIEAPATKPKKVGKMGKMLGETAETGKVTYKSRVSEDSEIESGPTTKAKAKPAKKSSKEKSAEKSVAKSKAKAATKRKKA